MPKGIYQRMQGSLRERFWAKVAVGEARECWPWRASHDLKGYGQFGIRHGRMLPAHRVSWEFNIGPIPPGLHVLHDCDNRECVNPSHLRLGTHADNMRDMKVRHRAHRNVGSGHPMAILNEKRALEARKLAAAGVDRGAIAGRFGVSRSTIDRLLTGRTWRHVV